MVASGAMTLRVLINYCPLHHLSYLVYISVAVYSPYSPSHTSVPGRGVVRLRRMSAVMMNTQKKEIRGCYGCLLIMILVAVFSIMVFGKVGVFGKVAKWANSSSLDS
jgi:hypothetical protein